YQDLLDASTSASNRVGLALNAFVPAAPAQAEHSKSVNAAVPPERLQASLARDLRLDDKDAALGPEAQLAKPIADCGSTDLELRGEFSAREAECDKLAELVRVDGPLRSVLLVIGRDQTVLLQPVADRGRMLPHQRPDLLERPPGRQVLFQEPPLHGDKLP